ncbi:MAG: hypothetical protein ACRD5H_11760 [Nitrososphaerales archaeon]
MPRPEGRFFPSATLPLDFEFPHMLPRERGMFRNWFHAIGKDFDGFMFDVRVGSGRPASFADIKQYQTQLGFSPGLTQQQQDFIDGQIRVAWHALTQKRIDAMGFRGGETWLIEVKKVFNMALLGQLDIYSILLLRDYPPDGAFIRAAIVGEVDPDIGPIASARGIQIFRV